MPKRTHHEASFEYSGSGSSPAYGPRTSFSEPSPSKRPFPKHGGTAGTNATEKDFRPFSAPGGDLILVVSPRIRFQVHSFVLKTAAPIFAAMLAPNFPPGAQHEASPSKLKEYHLPNVHPEALSVMCHVLHGSNDRVLHLAPAIKLEVAILVDKYGLVSRFRFAAHFWLQSRHCDISVLASRLCWTMAMAAYWFQHDEAFWQYTQRLIMTKKGSYLDYAQEVTDPSRLALGLRLCLAIEETRTQISNIKQQKKRGLCLYCFKTSKGGFKNKQSDCKDSFAH